MSQTNRRSVAVIGGGYTGASILWTLAAAAPEAEGGAERPEILLYEPRKTIGAGLAYDTAEPAYRVNVPAHLMELPGVEPGHFLTWFLNSGEAEADPEALAPEGAWFPRRAVFGRYMAEHVAPLLDEKTARLIPEKVVAAAPDPQGGWRLRSESGEVRHADLLVLAATHPAPAPPPALAQALAGHPKFVPDSTAPGALDVVTPEDRVLIVGMGLTGADVAAVLERKGHRGAITMISRRGLSARGRLPTGMEALSGEFLDPPETTALGLVRRVRRAVKEAADEGLTWRAVFDKIRGQGQEVWAHLPDSERRKLVARLRPFWDVHRFRTAPQVETVLNALEAQGILRRLAASVVSAESGESIRVRLRKRGGAIEDLEVDAVVAATGPAHQDALSRQPVLADLAAQGLLKLDSVGLGLACDRRGRALDREGRPVETLFVAGPLARGTFGELMGLPQVTDYAAFIAHEVQKALAPAESRS